MGGFIHVLLIVAIIAILVRVIYKDAITLVVPRSGGEWPTLAPRRVPNAQILHATERVAENAARNSHRDAPHAGL